MCLLFVIFNAQNPLLQKKKKKIFQKNMNRKKMLVLSIPAFLFQGTYHLYVCIINPYYLARITPLIHELLILLNPQLILFLTSVGE